MTIETVQHQGERYYRIEPASIDLARMTEVQKVTDVYAYRVKAGGRVRVETRNEGHTETFSVAHAGDWIVYNLGNGAGETLAEKLRTCDAKVLPDEVFRKLYARKDGAEDGASDANTSEGGGETYTEDISNHASLLEDVLADGADYGYSGRSVHMARVPFNFVLRPPWGVDQFISAGGYVVYNPNTSVPGHADIYGIHGAHDRHAGQMEKTYALVGNHRHEVIKDACKFVIAADRSPVVEMHFTADALNEEVQRFARIKHRRMEQEL